MSQPTHDRVPPAYLVHRAVLITVLVLAMLAAAYRLVPLADNVLEIFQSMIRVVRQTWLDLS
jgi:hypothetical protein